MLSSPEGRDKEISDNHLIAYRISKEEVMYNLIKSNPKIAKLSPKLNLKDKRLIVELE